MTTEQNNTETDQDTFEQELVSYLCKNPDFFSRHPDALAAINLPHDAGQATSLIERQVKTLRASAEKYSVELKHLVGIARENDQLAMRLHTLALKVIEANSFEELINTLQDQLLGQFEADAVMIKRFNKSALETPDIEPGPAVFTDFISKGKPSCGVLTPDQVDYLFGEDSNATGSAAIVPLCSDQSLAILGIGSHEKERFLPDMAVDFLLRLGEVISAKINGLEHQNDDA